MRYHCMSFGWYHEFLDQAQVSGLPAAESALTRMLDAGAMIVHVYGESNPDAPEMVGRHSRLRAFMRSSTSDDVAHEIERFLLDPSAANAWQEAVSGNRLLEDRWSVIDFWPATVGQAITMPYGRAMLTAFRDASPAAG